jgi:hypothetical protein
MEIAEPAYGISGSTLNLSPIGEGELELHRQTLHRYLQR